MMLKKVRFKVREGRKKSKVLFQVLFDIELYISIFVLLNL